MFVVQKQGIKSLSGCSYLLANGDGVSGSVGLSSSFEQISIIFDINSSAYCIE